MAIPRAEHPRPQFARDSWLPLNGEWEFEMDPGDSGLERGLTKRALGTRITVPFCMESPLSGIGHVDRMLAVWYRRETRIPKSWRGQDAVLHFQAVDYDATVWINGVEAGRHRGGFTPFSIPLRGLAAPGEAITIVVRARDDWRPTQPRGKQAQHVENHGCLYTRTTGMWQSVWMEAVPTSHLKRPRITPDLGAGCFRVQLAVSHSRPGQRVRLTLRDGNGTVVSDEADAYGTMATQLDLRIPKARRRTWSPADPHLYDLDLELLDSDGAIIDRATSYAGLRSISIDGRAILINGERIFQRLVLDQGWYADGLMTAPTDEALVRDIEISIAAGFNGARLHQKVFEERFLYHADRLGYLCWGEFGDWGGFFRNRVQPNENEMGGAYVAQWLEALERDYSHPCIIGWCPMNEHHQPVADAIQPYDDVVRAMFLATKAFDHTRPVLDISGYAHRVPESDVYDSHSYEQQPEKFKEIVGKLAAGKPHINHHRDYGFTSIAYRGQPYFVSEFGGAWWNPAQAAQAAEGRTVSWGYGDRPRTLDEFYSRFEGLVAVLLDDPEMFGYCYTQLTDVFQEQNGIFGFDRSEKFDLQRIRAAQVRPAAYELVGKAAAATVVKRSARMKKAAAGRGA
jgi:beta-galactosidase/beta-glucuronidase